MFFWKNEMRAGGMIGIKEIKCVQKEKQRLINVGSISGKII